MDQLAGGVQPRARSTCGRSTATRPVHDYNEYKPQLGRRFRALKLWMQLRWFGLDGLRRRIAHHLERGGAVRRLGRRGPGLGAARAGPVLDGLLPLPAGRRSRGDEAGRSTTHNARLMDAVNRTGEVFLSPHAAARPVHDPPRDRQPAHGARHVERAWELLRREAATPRPDRGDAR